MLVGLFSNTRNLLVCDSILITQQISQAIDEGVVPLFRKVWSVGASHEILKRSLIGKLNESARCHPCIRNRPHTNHTQINLRLIGIVYWHTSRSVWQQFKVREGQWV